MLIEIDTKAYSPMLVEIREVYPETKTFSGKHTGRTVLDSKIWAGPHVNGRTITIDLTYEEFKWAYANSVKNHEPFLDLISNNLQKIKSAYQMHAIDSLSPSFSALKR